MGPNALPVPEIKNGELSNTYNLKVVADKHFGTGDKTENLFTELYIPIHTNKVGLNINIVPYEHYDMDEATLAMRRIENSDGEGTAGGDFYIGTYIQILRDRQHWPDILLTLNLKTASGTDLENARFTDAPGYFFDLSLGKDINFSSSMLKSIKLYGMIGLYVWQIHRFTYFQDDALLYGFGIDLNFSKVELKNSFGGYSGFLRNGDRPVVFRSTLRSKFDSMVNYEIGFQQGMADIEYSTIRIGCNLDLGYLLKYFKKSQ